MASGLLIFPGAQPSRSRSGSIISAELRWCLNETTTPAVVYTDEALTIPHPFPIVSDDAGRFPLIWADTADFFSVNWVTAAPDSQVQSYDGLSASTAVDVQLLDTMNNLLGQAEDILDQVIAADTSFSMTSTTSATIGLGSVFLEGLANKAFLPGTLVTVASNGTPSAYMFGDVTDYDILNGQIYVNVTDFGGSGTYTDWNITLSGPQGIDGGPIPDPAGNDGKVLAVVSGAEQWTFKPNPPQRKASSFNCLAGYIYECDTTSGAFTATLPASPTDGDWVLFRDGGNTPTGGGFSTNALTIGRNGNTICGEAADTTVTTKGLELLYTFNSANTWRVS